MHACARLKRWCWRPRRVQMLSTSLSPWTPQRTGYPRSRLTASLTDFSIAHCTYCGLTYMPSIVAARMHFELSLSLQNLRVHTLSLSPPTTSETCLCHHQPSSGPPPIATRGFLLQPYGDLLTG